MIIRFLLVELQIDDIAKSCEHGLPADFDLQASLGKLASNLIEVYDSQLNRINNETPRNSKLAGRILSWLFYNAGSMLADQLIDILRCNDASEQDLDINRITGVCMSLVRYNDANNTISFFHFSFQEYLEIREHARKSNTVLLTPNWPLPIQMLSHACTQYLLEPKVSSPVRDIHRLRQKLELNPFFGYAAENWNRLCKGDLYLDASKTFLPAIAENVSLLSSITDVIFQNEDEYWQCQDAVRFSPIHFLTYFGCLDKLSRSLSSFTRLQRDFQGRSAVHVAAMMGRATALVSLLRWGQDPEEPNRFDRLSRNAWHYVAIGNHVDAARVLLQECRIDKVIFGAKDSKDRTPLSYAAATGHSEVLTLFLSECAKYILPSDRDAAIRLAIRGGHIKAVESLLSFGTEPNHDHLIVAIDASTIDIVTLLLEYGVSIDSGDVGSALHEATMKEKTPILSSLIWNGASLETTDAVSQTPLSVAVKQGYVEAVSLLLRAGANPKVTICEKVDATSPRPTVPAITWAVEHGLTEIFKLLSDAGAGSPGAFDLAVKTGRYEIVDYMLKRGAVSPTAEAIRLAEENGHMEVANLLEACDPSQASTIPSRKHRLSPFATDQQGEEKNTAVAPTSSSSTSDEAAGNQNVLQEQQELPVVMHKPPPSPGFVERLPLPVMSPSIRISSKSAPKGSRGSTFILLPRPVRQGALTLGSIVGDVGKPLERYVPLDQSYLGAILPMHFIEVVASSESHVERNTSSSTALGGFGWSSGRNKEKLLSIASPRSERWSLSRHEDALRFILEDPKIKQEYMQFIESRQTAYMISGLMIMDQPKIEISEKEVRTGGFSATVGAEAIAGASLSVGWDPPSRESHRAIAFDSGPMICAVQYRVLKKKWSLNPLAKKRVLDRELGDFAGGTEYDTVFLKGAML
jgi:ankyrin repeat protein